MGVLLETVARASRTVATTLRNLLTNPFEVLLSGDDCEEVGPLLEMSRYRKQSPELVVPARGVLQYAKDTQTPRATRLDHRCFPLEATSAPGARRHLAGPRRLPGSRHASHSGCRDQYNRYANRPATGNALRWITRPAATRAAPATSVPV